MTQIGLHTSGPPETVLPPEPAPLIDALERSRSAGSAQERHDLVVNAVASFPRSLSGWAELGDIGRDQMESYAAYRVGYHRGLDTLRQNGWRGSGYVRWKHTTNQPFLRCLAGLQRCAAAIGEQDEDERCALFLLQLDPSWPPVDSTT
jgi:hypothetical protein